MTPSFVFARVIFHAEALRVQRRNKHSFEFLMKMLFQYTDNPERELKLRNVQLLRQ